MTDHIGPVLRSLCWLQELILKLVYKALNGLGLKYISDLLLLSDDLVRVCDPRVKTKLHRTVAKIT